MATFFAYTIFFGGIFLIFIVFLAKLAYVIENKRDYDRTKNTTEFLLRSQLIRRLDDTDD